MRNTKHIRNPQQQVYIKKEISCNPANFEPSASGPDYFYTSVKGKGHCTFIFLFERILKLHIIVFQMFLTSTNILIERSKMGSNLNKSCYVTKEDAISLLWAYRDLRSVEWWTKNRSSLSKLNLCHLIGRTIFFSQVNNYRKASQLVIHHFRPFLTRVKKLYKLFKYDANHI